MTLLSNQLSLSQESIGRNVDNKIVASLHIECRYSANLSPNIVEAVDPTWKTCSMTMDPTRSKPEPLDLSHHYSHVTKNRGSSAVKDFYKYFRIPNIGNLAGGRSSFHVAFLGRSLLS